MHLISVQAEGLPGHGDAEIVLVAHFQQEPLLGGQLDRQIDQPGAGTGQSPVVIPFEDAGKERLQEVGSVLRLKTFAGGILMGHRRVRLVNGHLQALMGAAVADLLEDGPGRSLDLPEIGQSLALRHEFDRLGERQAVEAEEAEEQGMNAAQQADPQGRPLPAESASGKIFEQAVGQGGQIGGERTLPGEVPQPLPVVGCKAVDDKEHRLLGDGGVGEAPGGQAVDRRQFGEYLVLVVHEGTS